jgi:hypothetical protein
MAFTIVSNKTDMPIFLSEYDGEKWSPLRWIIMETNGFINVQCSYREIAIANYYGSPLQIIAPTGSIIGGNYSKMSIVPKNPPNWICFNTNDFQYAITNCVAGDTIGLMDGYYALTINPVDSSFSSNANAGWSGMEGVTIRGLSGNRDACVLGGAATNLGVWTVSSGGHLVASFCDLTFDITNSIRTATLQTGNWRLENVRFTGTNMVAGGGDTVDISDVGGTASIHADLLYCRADTSSQDLFNFNGSSSGYIRLVCCIGIQPGDGAGSQCITSHSTLPVEVYGGFYGTGGVSNAVPFASGSDAAPLFLFFIKQPISNVGGMNQSLCAFGCDIGETFAQNTVQPLVSGGYILFCKIGQQNGISCDHSRLFNKAVGNRTIWPRSGRHSFSGNIVTSLGTGLVNRFSSGVGTNSITQNTFVQCATGVDAEDTQLTLWWTNNVCYSNTSTMILSTTQTNGLFFSDFNTIDKSVSNYLPGANDLTNTPAALNNRLFPISGGSCDTNGATSTFVGDSDPFGYVLIYQTNMVPRGARARAGVFPGSALYPDLF